MRLNAKANINDSTSAFIQMQSTRIWGNSVSQGAVLLPVVQVTLLLQLVTGMPAVGLHEAYFTLKNFAGLPADLKFGRQQVVLDGHRLFGHTGWTTGAQTHDAIRLTHKGGNHTLSYVYIVANEAATMLAPLMMLTCMWCMPTSRVYWVGASHFPYAAHLDGCGNRVQLIACNLQANNIHTIGFRQAGKLYGIELPW